MDKSGFLRSAMISRTRHKYMKTEPGDVEVGAVATVITKDASRYLMSLAGTRRSKVYLVYCVLIMLVGDACTALHSSRVMEAYPGTDTFVKCLPAFLISVSIIAGCLMNGKQTPPSENVGSQVAYELLVAIAFAAYGLGDILMEIAIPVLGAIAFGVGHTVYALIIIFDPAIFTANVSAWRTKWNAAVYNLAIVLAVGVCFLCMPMLAYVIARTDGYVSSFPFVGMIFYSLSMGLAYLKADLYSQLPWLKAAPLGFVLFAFSDTAVSYTVFSASGGSVGIHAFGMVAYWFALKLIWLEEILRISRLLDGTMPL